MKRASLLTAGALVAIFAAILHAADTAELNQLQSSYRTAIERATRPLAQSYLADLEKLRDKYARATKLDAANAVQAEINAIKQEMAAAELAKKLPPPAQAPANTTPAGAFVKGAATPSLRAHPLEVHWFAGKTWASEKKTRWTFGRDGGGEKTRGNLKLAAITWKVTENGLVEVSERAAPEKPPLVQYIDFKSRSEAWMGPTPSELTLRLYVE